MKNFLFVFLLLLSVFGTQAMPFNVDYTSNNITCYGDGNGSIDTLSVNNENGTVTFKKLWNHGTSQEVITSFPITGLSADTFVMVATDLALNSDTDTIIIREPGFLGFHINWIGTICSGSNAIVSFLPYGGTSPYVYSFSHPADSTLFINDTAFTILPQPGIDYTFTIQDANGCSFTNHLNQDPAHLYVESQGYMSGYVMDGANYVPLTLTDTLWVSLIQVDPLLTYWHAVDSIPYYAPFDNTYYYFDSIVPGNYILRANYDTSIVQGTNYVTTYSGDVFNWTDATIFSYTSGCALQYSDINMLNAPILQQGGSLEGYIYSVDFLNKTEAANDPVPLIDIVVEKDSVFQNSVQAQLSSNNPNLYKYKFDNLPNGDYKIYVVVSGVPQYNYRFPVISQVNDSIINQNFCIDLFDTGGIDICNFFVDGDSVITTIEETPLSTSSKAIVVYPNPNSGKFRIQTSSDEIEFQSFELVALDGRMIEKGGILNGISEITLQSNPEKGIYLLKLIGQGKPNFLTISIH
ncbi:MAG: T9SS type A sorting domain-containing protein [Bacteroidia bacterium]|nr:T9SS type A sorting domain-containing protein [Bacteroidia bacterium]